MAVQYFFILYYFIKLARVKINTDTQTHRPISVIVCAHNEYENLKKLVSQLLLQNYHQFEIVIVNDRSYDLTEDFIKEQIVLFKDKIKLVTVEEIPSKMDAKKYALTLGIKAAKYDYVLLTDADCVPYNNNWILQMQAHATNEPCIVLGISQYEAQNGFLNNFIRYETFFTALQYMSFALRGKPYMGVGRNLLYHKSVFFDNKGFHPHMDTTGGDDDLFIAKVANKNNTFIAINIESQTVSTPKKTYSEWFVQKKRHLSVSKYYETGIKCRLGMLYFSNLAILILGCVLLFQSEYYIYILYSILLRYVLQIAVFGVVAKKLRYNLQMWLLPLFDLLYPIYIIVIGTNARFTKKVKWK